MAKGERDQHGEPGVSSNPRIDTSRPTAARVYDYLLGGKDNFEADRRTGDLGIAGYPQAPMVARAERAYLGRVVRFFAADAGIRQFLDIGTGLPSGDNVHEVAQRVAPESAIVYVDYDPVVLAHAEALLKSTPEGATDYLEGDLRNPREILDGAAKTLDFGKPVAVILLGILHYIQEHEDPRGIIRTLADALAPGSYLTIAQLANDIDPKMLEFTRAFNSENPRSPQILRNREQIAGFFDDIGMELVEPGIVKMAEWRPGSEIEAKAPSPLWAGVARKP
ncbi:MAG: SAM-dependent methyltransferase [Nocardiopsaceae bacterium]|nr:SAM-dependent methyltransferase [Nocardiopsaceae bacterium]